MAHATARFRELLLLLGLFACICWPLLSTLETSNFVFDELNYHLPAVRQIAEKWPAIDLVADSLSATAPGYHYALATLSQVTGHGMRRMRLINWALSAGLLAFVYLYARRSLSYLDASLLTIPLATSNFFIKSASWVVTDNAALLLVAIALFASLRPVLSGGGKFWLSLAAAAAVFVRQLTVWIAILPLARCIGQSASSKDHRWREPSIAIFMALPAAIVLSLLYRAWGGLVPPTWADTSIRFSTAGPVYLLSVVALFGIFFLPTESIRSAVYKSERRITTTAFLAGVLFSFTTETSFSYGLGRWGGYLWSLALRLPMLGEHSLLFAGLCGVGSVVVLLFWRGLRAQGEVRVASIFVLGLTAWASTFVVNRQIFHRYFEPTALIFLIAIGPFLLTKSASLTSWRWRMGACGAMQLIATFYSAHAAIFFPR
jgi:hypothetical protein